jgi:hypothetical protein
MIRFDKRAKDRQPYDVKDDLGNMLIASYPIHLSGFWDEAFLDLLVSCLKDDEPTIRKFEGIKVTFD